MIHTTENVPVSLEGGHSGESSKQSPFDGSLAFERQWFKSRDMSERSFPWVSSKHQSLPQSVWIRLPSPAAVATFSFRSRAEKIDAYPDSDTNWILSFSPTKFDLIGSDLCSSRKWITILHVENVNWTTNDEEQKWEVPLQNRKQFKCLGIQVLTIGGGKQAAIQDLKFWRGGDVRQGFLGHAG